jgi:COP9 signalosome complex subunit 3
MDDLLPKLLVFPQHPPPSEPLTDSQYDDAIRSHISTVKNISEGKLLQQTSSGESVLDVSPFKVPKVIISLTVAELAH